MRKAKRTPDVQILADVGPDPMVLNIDSAVRDNTYFRSTLWTGENLQITLMSLLPNEELGAEVHEGIDQFIKIQSGRAKVLIGRSAEEFYYQRLVDKDYAVIIPSGTWHNVINLGSEPLKLYSVYAPAHHEKGKVHISKNDDE